VKAKFGVISLLACLLLFGCARTVTQYVTYGDQLVVEVTLRGTMEIAADRYFMVLASKEGYKIPLPPPDNIDFEFIEPGTEPKLGTMADYYANFYSSWEGYVTVEPGGYFLVDGPFVMGQAITREPLASLGEISTKIQFNFRLSQIFKTGIPNTIYFDFIAVPWPNDTAKLPADHLTSTNAYVSKVAGSTVTVMDDPSDAIEPDLDILKCTVTIQ
jgi:hypothetical protein